MIIINNKCRNTSLHQQKSINGKDDPTSHRGSIIYHHQRGPAIGNEY